MKTFKLLFISSALLFTACSSTQKVNKLQNSTTQATLWVQNAAEYDALAYQAYASAAQLLPLTLEDSFWTASPNQERADNFTGLPPAVIMDIDETVLDNSPFQARMIKQGKAYNIEDWNAWCNEARAEGIAGAAEFANYAAERGIVVFYISNRMYEVEDATRRNLIKEGFPVSDSLDNIMTNGEEPGWNSSKINRRQLIEENFRVVMVFGDDLNDFVPAKDISQGRRDAIVAEYSEYFGRRWFVLPNPVYGSWDQALFDFENDLNEEKRNNILRKRLDTKN